MASVFDVADCLLQKHGPMTAMKLQKLVYYCQAWSLVWDDRPMFDNKIEAWANGPVSPALFDAHRGEYSVEKEPRGDCRKLDKDAIDTIDAVLKTYGDKSSQWLIDLTHREKPWRDARSGLPDGSRSNVEITHGAMADYYGNL
ncbi:type II toxin-antitoxin system antitoxin SocA domain-containing protein [Bradyrhizobium sp. 151]|uniref:Panacea domain-containing protein n=1 Tax=Bradyrhizobium sp. 151 TaxID=2782626 RepID=UPI001FF71DC9|nr:type II toxin-antitoxin system antitoxin SocA domain-containing protein [Bradyrhizobium sp. 151]MCK1661273.1 DUF4065 domain-containing protein [Bradyrhizobium sp. 151]